MCPYPDTFHGTPIHGSYLGVHRGPGETESAHECLVLCLGYRPALRTLHSAPGNAPRQCSGLRGQLQRLLLPQVHGPHSTRTAHCCLAAMQRLEGAQGRVGGPSLAPVGHCLPLPASSIPKSSPLGRNHLPKHLGGLNFCSRKSKGFFPWEVGSVFLGP